MVATDSKPLVVHVSGDFPDPVQPFKTPVIRDLVDLTAPAFDHRVISINRTSPRGAGMLRSAIAPGHLAIDGCDFEYGEALRYTAFGKGIWHRTVLERLGRDIVERCARLDRAPDLLIGHKLTIEGIAVRKAARILGVPYALSIQGNTDTKILGTRRDLVRHLARIYHEAETVFPFTPWALARVERALGKRVGPIHLLPCPTELDQPLAPRENGNGLISVFHLKNWQGKNLAGMVAAWKILAARGLTPALEIIGGGTGEELRACKELAQDLPHITFAGPMGRDRLAGRMNAASALIMPSLRESFGLVFIEALFAGAPVIYPQDTAIDGYFDDASFALRVDARSPESIADTVEQIMSGESRLKRDLAEWQHSHEAGAFTRKSIAETFQTGLERAISRG